MFSFLALPMAIFALQSTAIYVEAFMRNNCVELIKI